MRAFLHADKNNPSMLRAIPNNGHTAGNAEEEEEFVHRQQPVGIYGWRKRCLYAFILFLMVLTILNLALIVWILRVLNFSVVNKLILYMPMIIDYQIGNIHRIETTGMCKLTLDIS